MTAEGKYFVVVEIMSGSDLDGTGTKGHIHHLVGDDGHEATGHKDAGCVVCGMWCTRSTSEQ